MCLNKNTAARGVSVAGFVCSLWLSTGLVCLAFSGNGIGF